LVIVSLPLLRREIRAKKVGDCRIHLYSSISWEEKEKGGGESGKKGEGEKGKNQSAETPEFAWVLLEDGVIAIFSLARDGKKEGGKCWKGKGKEKTSKN